VLFDVSLAVHPGEVVTLMGRNGMGKTTTIKTILGMLKADAGAIRIDGKDMAGSPSYRVAQTGLGLVPEGRQVFPNLTVEENLVATAARRGRKCPGRSRPSTACFPGSKSAGAISAPSFPGGEQQMLAIGRALMTHPKLLILDEATEGLAPLIRAEIWSCLKGLKDHGQAILVVDKTVSALERLADRHVIIEKGNTVWTGSSADLAADPTIKARFLST
jgi:branched-chain amino acid transport system ATP-binding protein